ncbi:MAG TPA: TetR/AcrR family transcriptional regulator [Thermomicrobiales bacterium]|nr:TetR/AcrR family transcriptional regulator [Thermomicrobiales bacterium]
MAEAAAAEGSAGGSRKGAAKRGPYAKSAGRRREIIDEVLSVYNQRGIDGTSLRAIARAIGVTHPVLVHHFGTREELFLEVLREYDERHLALLRESGVLREFIDSAADYSISEPGLMALLNSMVALALETDNEHSRARFSARYAELRELLVRLLQDGQRAGTVRSDIPLEDTASLLIAAADGLTTQWLLDGAADFKRGLQLLTRLLEPPVTA